MLPEKETEQTPITVFYNLYIHPDEVDNALYIANDQIKQVRDSLVHEERGLRFHYVTVGHKIDDLDCGDGLECHRLDHYDQGWERITLQALHDHCQAHPEDTVAYLHSKGSYHPKSYQRRWRRLLTQEAMDCYGQMNTTCNFCGRWLTLRWTYMVPGNMMMAKCDYVKKLLPPAEYNDRMEEAAGQALYLSQSMGQLNTTRYGYRPDLMGLDRFSDEHWMGSHPDVQPCRPTGHDIPWEVPHEKTTSPFGIDKDERDRDYYLLPGQILKWMHIYGRAPSNSSWIWSHYPDGKEWKNAVAKYGDQVVDKVTEPYQVSLPTLFAKDQQPLTKTHNYGSVVLFYDAVLSSTDTSKIEDQVKQLTVTDSTVIVHTFGNESLSLCEECAQRVHFDRDYAGETFKHIHELCQTTDTRLVGYFQSRSSWIQTNITRVLDCSHRLQNGEGVNFCGSAEDSLEPSMWIATCEYLKRLPEPQHFVETLWPKVLRKAWLQHIRKQFTGMNRETSYSINRMVPWISSHPSMEPYNVNIPPVDEEELTAPDQGRLHFQRLAGYLFRWKVLFDEVPSHDSSLWKIFPDGDYFWNSTFPK